ncbi:MAG: EAL domain-containing protein [Thermodesulfobacteriota bacterium]
MKIKNLSLTRKALAAVIIILFPIVFVFLREYNNNRDSLKRYALDDLTAIAEAYEGQVLLTIETNKQRVEDFANDGLITGELKKAASGDEEAAARLSEHIRNNKLPLDPGLESICVISGEGRVVASTDASKIGMDVSALDFFTRGLKAPTAGEGMDIGGARPQLIFSAPVRDNETGELLGVVANRVDLSALDSLLAGETARKLGAMTSSQGRHETFETYLVGGTGVMLTSSMFVEGAAFTQPVDTVPVRACLDGGVETTGFYRDYRGVMVAGASMCLRRLGWVLLAEVDKAEMLAPLDRMRQSAIIAASIVAGLIMALLLLFIRTVVRPLGRMAAASLAMGEGDYDIAVPVESGDEVGALTSAFNSMASEIKARTGALERSEAMLKTAESIGRMGSWDWNIAGDTLLWTDEIYRIFGTSRREFGATYEAFLNFVHPDDRGYVEESVARALHDRVGYSIDHSIVLPSGEVRTVHEQAEVFRAPDGAPVRMVGTVLDVTERKKAEEERTMRLERIARQQSALGGLTTSFKSGSDTDESLREITRVTAETMGVERVSVWVLDDGLLRCRDLYAVGEGKHSEGFVLKADEYPAYFSALGSGRFIDAGDALADPRTIEFRDGYLAPLGITSMLDAPVRMGGTVAGVVCIEHVGDKRAWTPDEVSFAASIADLTAQALIEGEKRKAEFELKKLSAAIEHSVNILFITDIKGVIEYVNPTFEKVTGYTREEVIGQTPRILSSGETPQSTYEELWSAVRSGRTWRGSLKNRTRTGGFYWCNTTISPIKDESGGITHLLAVQEDTTEQMKSKERIEYLANFDPLTGLVNRTRFMKLLDEWIARASEGKLTGSLLIMDVDQFMLINDTYGHGTGDVLLSKLGRVIKAAVEGIYGEMGGEGGDRPLVGRLGGDEFAVFLPSLSKDEGLRSAERIREEVANKRFSDSVGSLTVSTGVVHYPDHGGDTRGLLTRADAANFRAKETGRNRCHEYRTEDHDIEKMKSRLSWKGKVIKALAEDRFVPWFQPILELGDGEVHHYEVLARMIDDDGKVLFPGDFIDVAERFGLVGAIDRVMIDKALKTQALLAGRGENAGFAMNLSGKDMGDDALLEFIKSKLKEYGAQEGNITFEITETEAIGDLGRAVKFVRALKDLGCRFAIDDFGVGYTSFTYLREMEVDFIKIDGSFIRRLHEDTRDQALVRAMVEVARGLDIRTIAEFVETGEALELLRKFGVDYAQGYFIGKPSPALAPPKEELKWGT